MSRVGATVVGVGLAGSLLAGSPSVAWAEEPTGLLDTVAAGLRAAKTGVPVVASALTDEHTLVTVDPTGLVSARLSAGVVRVRDGSGWREPSAVLQRAADGSWRPVAAAVQVTVSDGGSGAFLTITENDKSVGFAWPVASGF